MKLFENGVGRPSNETIKKRRTFIASIAIAIIAVLTIGVYALSNLNLSSLIGAVNYSKGQQISLSKVPVYLTASTKISLSKKTGTFYIFNTEIKNNRIRVSSKKNGTSLGWVNVNDISVQTITTTKKVTLMGDVNLNGKLDQEDYNLVSEYVSGNKTLSQEQLSAADMDKDGVVTATDAKKIMDKIDTLTTILEYNYTKGTMVYVKNVKIYSSATSKISIGKRSGRLYVHSATKKNERVKVGIFKNSMTLGWINIKDIDGILETEKFEVVYQKYNVGDTLSLVKETKSIGNKKIVDFERPTSKTDETQDYKVILKSGTNQDEVKVKDSKGKIYSVSKSGIAGGHTKIEKDGIKYYTYYHSLSEALNAATAGMTVEANCNELEETITIKNGVTLEVETDVTKFHNIINNGEMSVIKEIYIDEISGSGEFYFGPQGSIVLTGDKGINSTELKFNIYNSNNNLSGRSIITITKESAKDNVITATDKIVAASFNGQYTTGYAKCNNSSNCKGIGKIILIKK